TVLNEFPQLAAGNTSNVNNGGGSGVLPANLRGLGATRTLTLVNGRRFTPAKSDGVAALASIPDALVENVEIIAGGASAVYGSDAIAGAVNFILRKDFEGLEATYTRGETAEGDGTYDKFDLTIGGNFADGRGNAVLSISRTDREPVLQADREFSRVPLDTVGGQLVPGGSGSIPGTRIGLSGPPSAPRSAPWRTSASATRSRPTARPTTPTAATSTSRRRTPSPRSRPAPVPRPCWCPTTPTTRCCCRQCVSSSPTTPTSSTRTATAPRRSWAPAAAPTSSARATTPTNAPATTWSAACAASSRPAAGTGGAGTPSSRSSATAPTRSTTTRSTRRAWPRRSMRWWSTATWSAPTPPAAACRPASSAWARSTPTRPRS